MPLTEDSSVVKVAGRKAASLLEKNKGIRSVGDLLEFLPRRYLQPNELSDLSVLAEGETVVVVAQVLEATVRKRASSPGQPMLVVVLTDGRRRMGVTFFRAFGHRDRLRPGVVAMFTGTVSRFQGQWQLAHPDYEILGNSLDAVAEHLDRQIAVYSATGKVTSFRLRAIVKLALESLEEIREPLPEVLRARRGLMGRAEAVELIHRPRLQEDPARGVDRLRYDEAFVLQVILAQRRRSVAALEATARVPRPGGLLAAFDARLPFELTAGQLEVGAVLAAELARDRPMHRLLQGEVGSGKTVVALRAMLAAVDAGGQAALLAPTEVLAAQHHRSITEMLGDLAWGPFAASLTSPVASPVARPVARPDAPSAAAGAPPGTTVALLTGSQSAAARRQALQAAATGEAGIVVGTHALLQEQVAFRDLALVVVDEQHRFGVEQRDALREKGSRPPHLLVMTATPIPRTVAMTVFGDMETSTLRELPAGRSPIMTHIVDTSRPAWVQRTWQRVAEEVERGHQAYVVCATIGERGPRSAPAEAGLPFAGELAGAVSGGAEDAGELAGAVSGGAEDVAVGLADEDGSLGEPTGVYAMLERLSSDRALQGLRLAVLHGRLEPEHRDATMRAFTAGDVDVLVATTVIEVGVDVPNASVMVVVDADRFGISQLHQLRGRVGRGAAPGLCLLMTGAQPGSESRSRLEAVASTTDGFELARLDLEQRREGDVLGARQSGRASSVRFLRMGNRADEQLIAQAREDAFALVEQDPTLAGHPHLAASVAMRLDEEQAAYLERG